MIKEGKIGVQEAICLTVITITVKVYFTSPAFTAKIVGTSSWYMTLISAMTAMIGFTFLYQLLKLFPGKDLVQAFELSLGRVFGFGFSLILAIFLLINTAVFTREFAEVMKVYVFPLTPQSFIISFALGAAAVACFLGLESIARVARLFGFLLLLGFLSVIILAIPKYNYYYLFPFWGHGFDKTLITGVIRSSFYGEIIILGLIAASMQGVSHIKKTGYIALVISGLITAAALMSTMMAFNYATAQEIVSRLYVLTRIVQIGDFLQRLDPIFLFTWSIGSLIYISIMTYCTLTSYCKAFKIQDIRPLIMPLVIIVFAVSMVPKSLTEVTDYVHLLRQYGWSVYYIFPLIALIVATLRKMKDVQKDA
jgi:spore germination protein KB